MRDLVAWSTSRPVVVHASFEIAIYTLKTWALVFSLVPGAQPHPWIPDLPACCQTHSCYQIYYALEQVGRQEYPPQKVKKALITNSCAADTKGSVQESSQH